MSQSLNSSEIEISICKSSKIQLSSAEIRHIETDITVKSTQESSQYKNKRTALKKLEKALSSKTM